MATTYEPMDTVRKAYRLLHDPGQTWWICLLLWIFDLVLSVLIVSKIGYTEIDWKAYMQQIAQINTGERDYIKIRGETGPLVYGGGHVLVYRILHTVTTRGENIRLAQYIFIGVYLAALGLVMQCYRQARVPPYIFPLLVLSKRLHSIFLLRLFNDCFAVFFLFMAIFCWQKRYWTLGSLAYSMGLAVKMSLLLALPAIGVLLWQAVGRDRALRQAMVMLQLQILLGYPFLAVNARSYISRAFEFTRQFLFKWTVNWRFVGEQTFLSTGFSLTLLVAHASLIGLFVATRWLQTAPADAMKQLLNPPPSQTQAKIAQRVTPGFVLTSILSSMIVGCLCARSLHYQFYAYITWSTPFLLWRSALHPVLIYALWASQEWAWNVYPSSDTSSLVVVGVLLLTVLSVYVGTENEKEPTPSYVAKAKQRE